MERPLIRLTFLLLVFEAVWLIGDWDFPWNSSIDQTPVQSQRAPAGKILQTKQEVRRRSSKAILWEESRNSDTVYYNDSILTLSKSAAEISLDGQTQLSLSENTLVVIEPPVSGDTHKIRLRFAKGDLRTRSSAPQAVEAGDWSVELERGADLSLTGQADGKLQIEIKNAGARLKQGNQIQSVEAGTLTELTEDRVLSTTPVLETLTWDGPEELRLYTNQPETQLHLQWTGQAGELEVQKQGAEIERVSLPADSQSHSLRLKLGSYNLRLKGPEGVSNLRRIHIWSTPQVKLLYPLPRDRMGLAEPFELTWSPASQATRFRVEVLRASDQIVKTQEFASNQGLLQVPEEGEFFWRVIGIDDKGFEFRNEVTLPIFVVKDPLQAPTLRAPAQKRPGGASLENKNGPRPTADALRPSNRGTQPWISWSWTRPLALRLLGALAMTDQFTCLFYEVAKATEGASAASPEEVSFEWESVQGAQAYVVEIDSNGDFVSPLKIQKVTGPQFTWQSQATGTFYWRVAAEGTDGRKGRFSSPSRFVVEALGANRETASVSAEDLSVELRPTAGSKIKIKPRKSQTAHSGKGVPQSLPKKKLEKAQAPLPPLDPVVVVAPGLAATSPVPVAVKPAAPTPIVEPLPPSAAADLEDPFEPDLKKGSTNLDREQKAPDAKSSATSRSAPPPTLQSLMPQPLPWEVAPVSPMPPATMDPKAVELANRPPPISDQVPRPQNEKSEAEDPNLGSFSSFRAGQSTSPVDFDLAWMPSYSSELLSRADASAAFKGFAAGGFQLGARVPFSAWRLHVTAQVRNQKWKPTSASEYPYQKDLEDSRWGLRALGEGWVEGLLLGLEVQSQKGLRRVALEEVSWEPVQVYGPTLISTWGILSPNLGVRYGAGIFTGSNFATQWRIEVEFRRTFSLAQTMDLSPAGPKSYFGLRPSYFGSTGGTGQAQTQGFRMDLLLGLELSGF